MALYGACLVLRVPIKRAAHFPQHKYFFIRVVISQMKYWSIQAQIHVIYKSKFFHSPPPPVYLAIWCGIPGYFSVRNLVRCTRRSDASFGTLSRTNLIHLLQNECALAADFFFGGRGAWNLKCTKFWLVRNRNVVKIHDHFRKWFGRVECKVIEWNLGRIELVLKLNAGRKCWSLFAVHKMGGGPSSRGG